MSKDSNILREHINGLSDEELTAMVTTDRAQYREEAIAFAKAELRRRGLRAGRGGQDDAAGAPSSFWGEPAWGETPPEAGDESEDPEDAEASGEADSEDPAGISDEDEFWQEPRASVAFRIFRSSFTSWEDLFQQAADFAAEVGPERVISISHSADRGDGVVTVWYRA